MKNTTVTVNTPNEEFEFNIEGGTPIEMAIAMIRAMHPDATSVVLVFSL